MDLVNKQAAADSEIDDNMSHFIMPNVSHSFEPEQQKYIKLEDTAV